MYKKHQIGKLGEELASKYLQNLGYKIIETNFFCKCGEIDIIAKHNKELVFIEVKTRTNQLFGLPIDAIDKRKQKHLLKTITYYLYTHHLENCFIRIDAIEVLQTKQRL